MAIGAQSASASLGELSFLGCLGQLSGCTALTGELKTAVEDPKGLAVSPDGAYVYAADEDASVIDVFSRSTPEGTLTFAGCIGQHAGCATTTPAKAVERPFAVAVSPDGRNVYAASVGSNAVDEFSRNSSTGSLTYTGCIGQLAGCTSTSPAEAVGGPLSIAISADGSSVYVANENDGGVVDEFQRNAESGALDLSGCIGELSGCTRPSTSEALRAATAVAISPDGSNVYVGGQGASVATLTRNPANGSLTFDGCIGESKNCSQTSPSVIDEPTSLAVSPDGANVYAGDFADDTIDTFSRDTTTGALTFSGCDGAVVSQPGVCGELAEGNPEGPLTVAASPDGADVYVGSNKAVYEYSRGSGGALVFAGCTGDVAKVCTPTDPEEATLFTVSLALSPDGANLYAGAETVPLAIDVFGRATLPPKTQTGTPSPNTPAGTPSPNTPAGTPASVPSPAPSPTATAAQLILACTTRKLALTDVFERGSRVLLDGAAAKSLVGKRVKIVFDEHGQVASAVVGANGLFSTSAPLPPAKIRNTNSSRYQAEYGAERSLDLKLTRRLILDPPTSAAGKVALTGEVLPPLAKPPATIVVQQQVSCTKTVDVAHIVPSASGRFHISVQAPPSQQAAIYRLTTLVRANAASRKGFATFSLPEAVEVG